MRKTNFIIIGMIMLMLSACATANVKPTSQAAVQPVPDFTLADQNGKLWKLSDVLKDYKGVVLAFYAKDDTKL